MGKVLSLLLFSAVLAMVIVGPDWPARKTALVCGDSADKMHTRDVDVLVDMNACEVAAMGRGAEPEIQCYCSVRETWLAPAYYLALVPMVLIAAVWFWNPSIVRGMAAAVGILGSVLLLPWSLTVLDMAGVRIPQFFQGVAIFLPQFVFFGPALFRSNSSRLVLPDQWSYILTLVFWAMAAAIFGVLARRVRSFRLLLPLATVFVAAATLLIHLVVPLVGWRLIFEGL